MDNFTTAWYDEDDEEDDIVNWYFFNILKLTELVALSWPFGPRTDC